MDNYKKNGEQIALLRKNKGLTGEKLAEALGVTPQAVSKWETGKCLPESSILPLLSQVLDTSIDSILMPKELQILNATYGDGIISFDVKRLLDNLISNNKLNVIINKNLFGYEFDSNCLRILTVKYQTEYGIFFTHVCDNSVLSLDAKDKGIEPQSSLKIVDAFYGTESNYRNVMNKIQHYNYFNQSELLVNHETFPSSVNSEEAEHLTIIYISNQDIHIVSCKEGQRLCFSKDRKYIYIDGKLEESFILNDIIKLNWGIGMDCTWAGAMFAALKYMGHGISYDYIMGVSAACFRIAFSPVWDFSSVDALVVYDYAKVAYKAIGYELIWADRIEKDQRALERNNIIKDIKLGKPPIAINLRVAPEWGVITGYLDNGKEFLCRTYFDEVVFNDKKEDTEFQEAMLQNQGYLNVDCWPFAIAHFGKKLSKPTEKENLINSLRAKVESMAIPEMRGYLMGYEAYKGWIEGLLNDSLFTGESKEIIERRLQVNDYQLLNLLDARKSATNYLKASVNLLDDKEADLLQEIAEICDKISKLIEEFYNKLRKQVGNNLSYMDGYLIQSKAVYFKELRKQQADMLKEILELEYKADDMAEKIISSYEESNTSS